MPGIIVIYVVLIVIFLVVSSLIFRHAVKFSHLSPRFKVVTIFFGVVALTIIIISVYLLVVLNRASLPGGGFGGVGGGSSVNGSGLQF